MAMGGHGFREGTACACLAAARPTRCPGPLLAYALPPALPLARSSPTPCRPPCPWPLWGKLFKIVLGLMCLADLSGGGESQNEAKSRRFGIDMPSRAFYEGVNPKTIWNNCHR